MRATHALPRFPVRRDGGNDRDDAVARQEPCDESEAADILVAIALREAEVAAQMHPDLIAVRNLHAEGTPDQLRPYAGGQRRFAGARQTGQPQGEAGIHLSRRLR